MKIISVTPVQFDKPFFVFNKGTKEVIVPPTIVEPNSMATLAIDFSKDEFREAETIDELMAMFDSLGLVMKEQDIWDFPERPLRLAIPNDDVASIILTNPSVALKLEVLKQWIVVRNRTQLVYLESVDDEEQPLYFKYGTSRPN